MRILGWTLMRRAEIEQLGAACHEHNLRANKAESAELRQRKTIQQLRERAEFAEATVQGQNGIVARLMEQSERMIGIIADMRRLGFAMPADLGEPNDALQSVADDDAAAVKADPTLAASEWE